MLCSRENLIQNLTELVKIPSISGSEEKIALKVSEQLKTLGLSPQIDSYFNVQAELGSGKTLLLNAHLDTVPPGDGWSVDPYSAKFADGKIFGVGSSDNKSGVAVMLEIARILSRNMPNGKVIFLFTSREESQKKEARNSLVGRIKADAGLCFDTHIFAKEKIIEAVAGCRGVANFTVKVYGKAYHSSEPEKGVNAIYRSIKAIQAIRNAKLPSISKPLKVTSNASVTKMNTDGWPTKIPDHCNFTINYRALPNESRDIVKARVQKLVSRSLRDKFEVESGDVEEGYLISLGEEILRTARKAAREIGFATKSTVAKGWVDAAFFSNTLKIPTICIGPTTYGQAHIKDEYEDVENLIYGSEIILRTAINFLS